MPRPLALFLRLSLILTALVMAGLVTKFLGRDILDLVHRIQNPVVSPGDQLRLTLKKNWPASWGPVAKTEVVAHCGPGDTFAICADVTTTQGLTVRAMSPDGEGDLTVAVAFPLDEWRPALALQKLADLADTRPVKNDWVDVPEGLAVQRITRLPDRMVDPDENLMAINGTVMQLALNTQDQKNHVLTWVVVAPWSLMPEIRLAELGEIPRGSDEALPAPPGEASTVGPLVTAQQKADRIARHAMVIPSRKEQIDNDSDHHTLNDLNPHPIVVRSLARRS